MTYTVTVKKQVPVTYLNAEIGVRYWEDAKVNGAEEDDDNPKIPLKNGDSWDITISLELGRILSWPKGVTADVHYKVCDAGVYRALDSAKQCVAMKDGYVPSMLSPGGDGFGDYVIMKIDGDGIIEGWKADMSYFEEEDE